jgi:hypothetical protein
MARAKRVSLGGPAAVRFPGAQLRRAAISSCWQIRCEWWDSTYLFDGFDVVAVRDWVFLCCESSMPNSSPVPEVLGTA